ncbi:MAG TPA: hypothetical protein VLB82_11870, partial [Thermodesulfobacteriota bacterium]|nr:hypothetical protein [Thermodesulfobacteriota bacterium]
EIVREVYKGRLNKKTKQREKDSIERWATLKISDCDRVISLDLDFYSKRSAEASLKKVKLLADTLQEFYEAYKSEVEEYCKEKKKNKFRHF